MRFTDIFIRRPVLAVSISLLIIILGLQAISKLAVREYPKMTTTNKYIGKFHSLFLIKDSFYSQVVQYLRPLYLQQRLMHRYLSFADRRSQFYRRL